MAHRLRWPAVLALLALLLGAWPARAHDMMMGAYVNMTPPKAEAGQAAELHVEVVDPLNNPVPGLRMEALVQQKGEAPVSRAPLREVGPGKYQATVSFPADGIWQVVMEAHMGDALWGGLLPVVVGPQAIAVTNAGVGLVPVETGPEGEGPGRGIPWVALASVAAILIFAGALLVAMRRSARDAATGGEEE